MRYLAKVTIIIWRECDGTSLQRSKNAQAFVIVTVFSRTVSVSATDNVYWRAEICGKLSKFWCCLLQSETKPRYYIRGPTALDKRRRTSGEILLVPICRLQ